MRPRTHVIILLQAVLVWLAFWIVGLPDYYQQYPTALMGVASVVLSTVISLLCLWVLLLIRPERRQRMALWLSLYYTLPFALLDTLYCGVYLGLGADYLVSYWYLTVFYVTPWLTFLPTAALLRRFPVARAAG